MDLFAVEDLGLVVVCAEARVPECRARIRREGRMLTTDTGKPQAKHRPCEKRQ